MIAAEHTLTILASVKVTAATNTEIIRVDKTRKIGYTVVCDRSGSDQNPRLWVIPRDQAVEDKYAWIYDQQLPKNSTLLFPMNSVTLVYGDSIWAYGSGGSLSVNVAD